MSAKYRRILRLKMQHSLSKILLTALYLTGVASADGPRIVGMQFSSDLVQVGDSIQLKCMLENIDSQHELYIYKQGVDPNNGQITWYKLARNEIAEYPSLPFSFWINQKGANLDYMMRVQNSEVTMSGNYSCIIKSAATSDILGNKTAEVNVIVEPTSVKLYVDGQEIEPNATKLYNYASVHNLQCVASGSNPAAKIDIWHGNQDWSRRATKLTVSKPVYSPPTSSQFPFLAPISRSVNVTIENWRIDVTYHVAALVCLARTSTQSPGRTVKFTPVVEDGPPHFICNDSYIFPTKGNEDDGYDIECRVLAKPALTAAKIGCEPSSMCGAFSLFPIHKWHPESDRVFSGALQNTDPNSPTPKDVVQGMMILRIKMKREYVIGRSYGFTAENALGVAFHKLTLVNGGSTMPVSVALCMIALIVSCMSL